MLLGRLIDYPSPDVKLPRDKDCLHQRSVAHAIMAHTHNAELPAGALQLSCPFGSARRTLLSHRSGEREKQKKKKSLVEKRITHLLQRGNKSLFLVYWLLHEKYRPPSSCSDRGYKSILVACHRALRIRPLPNMSLDRDDQSPNVGRAG